jgi:hypothetical protein
MSLVHRSATFGFPVPGNVRDNNIQWAHWHTIVWVILFGHWDIMAQPHTWPNAQMHRSCVLLALPIITTFFFGE